MKSAYNCKYVRASHRSKVPINLERFKDRLVRFVARPSISQLRFLESVPQDRERLFLRVFYYIRHFFFRYTIY